MRDLAPLLTATDVAKILRCSTPNVYALAKRGDLPRVVFGSCVRFMQEDVEEFIARYRKGGVGVKIGERKPRGSGE
jgi:excisionase family DNA binding protein